MTQPGTLSWDNLDSLLKKFDINIDISAKHRILNLFGLSGHAPSSVKWINKLLATAAASSSLSSSSLLPEINDSSSNNIISTRMIDTFRATYPNTAYRYSCFEGLRRFSNRGNRIDYILMDESLWDHVKISTSNSLFTGSLTDENDNLSDKEKALHAVTNNKKLSKDSSFEPSDINLDDVKLHSHQVPHTGFIYTPYHYSDHIAVSLLIKRDDLFDAYLTLETDQATRISQPQSKQTLISTFFSTSKKQKL